MNSTIQQLTMADGTSLHVEDRVVDDARGGIVIMHGIGEHGGRYQHVAQHLNRAGWSVRTYDHRGHGRSRGVRGDLGEGSDIVQDAKLVIDDFARKNEAAPFLLGHSMGGLFAAHFALARLAPLRGLILSSPALAVPLTGMQRRMLALMQAIAPHTGVPNGLKAQYLSHDAAVVAAYKADPLVHGKISASLLRAMLDSVALCEANAASLDLPALMLVAGDDHLVDSEGSRRFFAKLPPGLADMRWYEGFYHEIFNEIDQARPLAAMCTWLAAQDAL
jgi:alpha-beta hydrolase superfamily lysophospholipase